MKILPLEIIYTYDIFCGQRYGGISRYYFELIRHISPERAHVKLLAGLYVNEYIKSLPEVKGIKVPQLKFSNSLRIKISGIFQAIMLRKISNKTIVHQTYYYQPIINHHGIIVLTVYDMISEIFPQYMEAGDNSSFLKRYWVEKADKIIAISHSTKNDIVRLFGISPEKIAVIHLASSLKDLYSLSDIKPFPDPYLLFVGKRGYYKNFDGLIKAFAASDILKSNFHIISFGGEPVGNSEKGRLKQLGIEGRVHFVRGSDALLCNYYKNAVACICPSLYEGFGIPILEAMELSCPVVCSDTSSIPEVAGDAAVYFDPTDVASLQQALESTVFDRDLLDNLRQRGLQRHARFSWERCANETLAVYHSLIH
jgi:glycosyltransferase involved in cell wall biosynthesis